MSSEIIYIPEFQPTEITDPEISIDPYNMDAMQRTYAMMKSDRDKFMRRLAKNKPDKEFPTMFMMTWDFTVDRKVFYICTVKFSGLIDGKIRAPVISDSVSPMTVQAQSLNGTQVEIDYYGFTTTYRYASTDRPTSRRFPSLVVQTDFNLQIYARRGSRSGNARTSGINNAVAGDYYLQPQLFTSAFTSEPVGKYWRTTEATTQQLIEQDLIGFGHNVAA